MHKTVCAIFFVLLISTASAHTVAKTTTPDSDYLWIWDELSSQLPGDIVGDDPVTWGEDLGAYYNSIEVSDKLTQAANSFPEIVSLETLGYSYYNRTIMAARVTLPDTSNVVNGKVETIVVGGIHALDAITVIDALFLLDSLLFGYAINDQPTISILKHAVIYIVPVLNPDGLDTLYVNPWTLKNLRPVDDNNNGVTDESMIMDVNNDGYVSRTYSPELGRWVYESNDPDVKASDPPGGVDLALNFDYKFGKYSTEVDGENYAGASPFSEPETQGCRSFVANHKFSMFVALYSGEQGVQFPEEKLVSENDRRLYDSIGKRLTAATGLQTKQGLVQNTGNIMNWMYSSTSAISVSLFGYSNPFALRTENQGGQITQSGIWDVHNPAANDIYTQIRSVMFPAMTILMDYAVNTLSPVHQLHMIEVGADDVRVSGNVSGRATLELEIWNDEQWIQLEPRQVSNTEFDVMYNTSGIGRFSQIRFSVLQNGRATLYELNTTEITTYRNLVSPSPWNLETGYTNSWHDIYWIDTYGNSPPAQVSVNRNPSVSATLKDFIANILMGVMTISTPIVYVLRQRKKGNLA